MDDTIVAFDQNASFMFTATQADYDYSEKMMVYGVGYIASCGVILNPPSVGMPLASDEGLFLSAVGGLIVCMYRSLKR
jgi:hypothetical protein